MPRLPEGHPLTDAQRRIRARQIAFLRSEPDPDTGMSTEEEMDQLFGGLPETDRPVHDMT